MVLQLFSWSALSLIFLEQILYYRFFFVVFVPSFFLISLNVTFALIFLFLDF